MKFCILSDYCLNSPKRLWIVLLVAILFSVGLSAVLAPIYTVQAGFTPTPIPPTPTNTPDPTSTPTPTPVVTAVVTEETPLLPETGGTSWFPLVVLTLLVLVIAGFGWAGLNRSREYTSRK